MCVLVAKGRWWAWWGGGMIMCFGVRMEEGENKKTWHHNTTEKQARIFFFTYKRKASHQQIKERNRCVPHKREREFLLRATKFKILEKKRPSLAKPSVVSFPNPTGHAFSSHRLLLKPMSRPFACIDDSFSCLPSLYYTHTSPGGSSAEADREALSVSHRASKLDDLVCCAEACIGNHIVLDHTHHRLLQSWRPAPPSSRAWSTSPLLCRRSRRSCASRGPS